MRERFPEERRVLGGVAEPGAQRLPRVDRGRQLGTILPEDEGGVGAPEAERVAERDLHVLLARLVGDVVQVAVRVRRLVVDGGRQDPVVDRKSTRLNSSHSSISYAVFC